MSARKKVRAKAENQQKKAIDKKLLCKNLLKLFILIAVTLTVYVIYSVFVEMYFYPVMITYTVLASVSILTYVIYNRGFSRKGITPEMLPDTMSDEEKAEFIEDGNRRLKRSRPLLVISFAFIFTFAMDIFILYTIPFFAGLFGR
ncbi:MAG: hypothetical protein J6U86_04755 [Clostridia bacterium]|nr:hypothetical protein [Clostridia bacterium]